MLTGERQTVQPTHIDEGTFSSFQQALTMESHEQCKQFEDVTLGYDCLPITGSLHNTAMGFFL